MLTNRQKLILKAIVESYISNGQPVGSKQITELPFLNYSSATIRFDMQILEELGLLDKTHTSSGRVPSKTGLRYYIDNLLIRDKRVMDLFPLVDDIFQKNRFSKRRTLEKAADLLSAITNYTAIGINPSENITYVKKLEFIELSIEEGVLLIVLSDGTVLNHKITIANDVNIFEVSKFFQEISKLFTNRSVSKIRKVLQIRYQSNEMRKLKAYELTMIEIIMDLIEIRSDEQFYLSGLTNMFDDKYFSSFDSLKESIMLLNEANITNLISNDTGLEIRLGSDISFMPKSNFTIVSIPYRFSDMEHGSLALLGPTRMNYQEVIPLIEYVAVNLSQLYQQDKE